MKRVMFPRTWGRLECHHWLCTRGLFKMHLVELDSGGWRAVE